MIDPIVFLDIDGVLNSPKNYRSWCLARDGDPKSVKSLMPAFEDPHVLHLFDEACVAHLNTITDRAKARIVISSSWRFWFAERVIGAVTPACLRISTSSVMGVTPPANRDRAGAICEWLRAVRPKGQRRGRMAILDDQPPEDFPRLKNWLVQTSGAVGLTERHVMHAVWRLSR